MANVLHPKVSDLLKRGESARLFPVPVGKAAQERHTTSVVLACLSLVPALGRAVRVCSFLGARELGCDASRQHGPGWKDLVASAVTGAPLAKTSDLV